MPSLAARPLAPGGQDPHAITWVGRRRRLWYKFGIHFSWYHNDMIWYEATTRSPDRRGQLPGTTVYVAVSFSRSLGHFNEGACVRACVRLGPLFTCTLSCSL